MSEIVCAGIGVRSRRRRPVIVSPPSHLHGSVVDHWMLSFWNYGHSKEPRVQSVQTVFMPGEFI